MTTPSEQPPAADRTMRWCAFGIAAGAVLARAWMLWKTHSTAEDFLITLRYAENIAHGHGFVYNLGERVLGTTTPLYTLLLAFAACLHLDAALFGKACNILADGMTCWLLARLLAQPSLGRPVAGLFASVLYALSSTPINISIGGMETALVTCAGMAAINAYVARNTRVLYLLAALLFLLRVDTLLLTGLLMISLAWQTRRIPWRDLAVAVGITLPWLLFAFAYFGSPVPTSLVAKVLVYSQGAPTPRHVIFASFATQFLSGWFQRLLTLLFIVGMIYLTPWPPSLQGRGSAKALASPISPLPFREGGPGGLGPALLWLLLYYGTMLLSRVPAFPWYFLPPWPLFLAIAALGGAWLAELADRRLPPHIVARLHSVWPVALLACGLFGLAHLRGIERDIAQTQWVEDSLRVPIGLWLHDHAGPQERILLEPIGYVGYYSQKPILDMIGLVSPEVFPSYRRPDSLADIVRRLHPDWLCLRPLEVAQMAKQGQALPDATYQYVREFHVPGRPPDFLLFHRHNREKDSPDSLAQ